MTFRSVLFGTIALVLTELLLAGCATARSRSVEQPLSPEAETEQRIRSAAHYATALSHDLNDQPELALNDMLRAAEYDPTYEPIVIDAARRCLRAQQPDRAIELLLKATSNPEASGALYAWLGLAYAQTGKTDLAISANRKAIQKLPKSLTAYQNLAQLFLQNQRPAEALQILHEAAQQPAEEPGFFIDLAELYVRIGRNQPGQLAIVNRRVREVLDRAASLGPTDPVEILRLADSFFALGELEKAEPWYRLLVEDHPDLPALRGKLTEIYLRAGDKAKASQQLEALARSDPTNPQAYVFLGAIAAEEKKYEEAAEHLERALRLDPDLEQIYYDLAGIRLAMKQPEDALAILDKARDRFKLSFALEFYTGVAHAGAKNYVEALKALTSAEAIARATDPSRLNQLFYFQLGATQERAGRFDEAEKSFRECLKLAPDDPETLNYLGYMWADRGVNLEEARTLIEKAVQLEPKNAAFLDSLAWVLFKLKKPKEALDHMLKAIEHAHEPDPTLYDHLGDIYAALQQDEQARTAWRKALEMEPNPQIQRKLAPASGSGPSLP